MGIIANIKLLAPWSLYITGVLFVLRGLTGDGRWALLLITFLIPLRNIIEKIQGLPLGSQFIDILIIASIIGAISVCLKENRSLLSPSYLNFISFMLISYIFVSLLVGNDNLNRSFSFDDDRVKDWKNFSLMPLLFFLVNNQITDRKWIKRVLMVMLMSISLTIYYTVSQITSYSSLISREKISGTFQFLGPNEVAAFFNQYTIIMISIIFFIKDKRIKWLLLAIICANIYCILFLYSRGAYLGLLGGMLFVFSFKSRKFLIPIILLILFWQLILPQKVVERIKNTETANGQLDESAEGRLIIWHQAMDLFRKSPLIGIGFGVFRNLGLMLADTHNIYVKILVEQGLVGMLIFLVVIFCFLRMGYVLYKKGEDDLSKGMGLGLMACIIVVMINSFFGDRWSYFELSAFLWIYAGLVARLINISQNPMPIAEVESQRQVETKSPSVMPPKRKKIRYYDL